MDSAIRTSSPPCPVCTVWIHSLLLRATWAPSRAIRRTDDARDYNLSRRAGLGRGGRDIRGEKPGPLSRIRANRSVSAETLDGSRLLGPTRVLGGRRARSASAQRPGRVVG